MSTLIETLPVWLFGARGMLAGEFLRLLDGHGGFHLAGAVSRTPGSLAEAHPQLGTDAETCTPDAAEAAIIECAQSGGQPLVVFGLPHGESAGAWSRLAESLGGAAERVSVVDLAADFRLKDPELYAATYGREHPAPDELAKFVYGLPEFERAKLQGATRVAAPGCFATALQLAVLPAAKAGLLDASKPWILNAVTGSSGSGNTPQPGTHHPHRNGNYKAYSLGGHRHEAELCQALGNPDAPLYFLPHSGPFARGIHLTASLPLAGATATEAALDVYRSAYAGEPFVEVLEHGVPELRTVVGSNRASLAVHVRSEVLTVLLTLDNIVKGGAGQALQCMNLMQGMPETQGLSRAGMGTA